MFNIYSVHKYLLIPYNGAGTVAGAGKRAVSLADKTWSTGEDKHCRRSFHRVISARKKNSDTMVTPEEVQVVRAGLSQEMLHGWRGPVEKETALQIWREDISEESQVM